MLSSIFLRCCCVSFLIFGEIMSRCYDNGVHVDEELFPALNDESNPVLKNKKVSEMEINCSYVYTYPKRPILSQE